MLKPQGDYLKLKSMGFQKGTTILNIFELNIDVSNSIKH